MLMEEAMRIINGIPKGFMVSFDHYDGRSLLSDHFPKKHAGEPLIKTEEEAWVFAEKFGSRTIGKCVRIHVTDDRFHRVSERIINDFRPYKSGENSLAALQPHQQRVIDEKTELDKNAKSLKNFIGTSPVFETLSLAEQERLKKQNDVMWQYSEILGARIAAF